MTKESPEKLPLETAVSVVLESDELQDLLREYAEVGIDALMEEGLARDLPVVGTVVGAYRVVGRIRDRMFLKKLLNFLGSMKSTPAAERQEIVRKLEADPDYGRKVGEHLLDLLDRISAHRKPAMLSRIFLAYSRSEVNAETLHRLFHAVEQLPTFEISALRTHAAHNPHAGWKASCRNLASAGLVHLVSDDGLTIGCTLSDVGDKFLDLELDRLP